MIRMPVPNDEPPTDDQALQWLTICERHRRVQKPIYVHCKAGEGRTSVFCALVRLAQGWNIDRIIEEQRGFDFQPEQTHALQAIFLRSCKAANGSLT